MTNTGTSINKNPYTDAVLRTGTQPGATTPAAFSDQTGSSHFIAELQQALPSVPPYVTATGPDKLRVRSSKRVVGKRCLRRKARRPADEETGSCSFRKHHSTQHAPQVFDQPRDKGSDSCLSSRNGRHVACNRGGSGRQRVDDGTPAKSFIAPSRVPVV